MSELNNDLLPFDETASKSENYLLGKSYTITNVGQEDYQQLTLRQGVFYTKDFKIVHSATGTTLTEGIDYQFSYFCREVHDVLGLFAFAGIILLNKNLYGELLIDARYVGGDYGAPKDTLIPKVVKATAVNSTYLWEDVEGVPTTFPVTDHEVSSKTLTEGFDDMVAVLGDINTTIQGIGKVQPGITIDWVEGLQEALDAKFENGGLNQINRLSAVVNYPGYLEIQLPEVELLTKTMLEFSIATKDALYDIAVGGIVSGAAANTEAWTSTSAKIVGPARTIEVLTGYRTNRPTVVIGPFSDGVVADKLLVNLNHYMLDGMSASFTPDFSVVMLDSRPAGWTNITNRANANDHTHEISAINGLTEKHASLDQSISNLNTATSDNTQDISDLDTAVSQLTQNNANEHQTLSQAIQSNASDISDVNTALTNHITAAGKEWDKIQDNADAVSKLDTYLKGLEEVFTLSTGSVLTVRGSELDKSKVYEITLVGSKAEGDVYRGIVRSINDSWSSVATTLGAQQASTPVLVVETGQIKVKCFDNAQSDSGVIVAVRCLNPANKLT